MKYWVSVGDRTLEVEVRQALGQTTVVVDGREVDIALEEGGQGIYTLLVDGQSWDLAAAPRPRGEYSISVAGVPFDVKVEDERQRRFSSARELKPVEEGKVTIWAPMPGLVSRVDVVPGDEVHKGKRLVVLEAMKMENDLIAPREARVQQVLVTKGDKVDKGQLLVVLE